MRSFRRSKNCFRLTCGSAWQPQRDSNPSLHLEREVAPTAGVRSSRSSPGQGPVGPAGVRSSRSVPPEFGSTTTSRNPLRASPYLERSEHPTPTSAAASRGRNSRRGGLVADRRLLVVRPGDQRGRHPNLRRTPTRAGPRLGGPPQDGLTGFARLPGLSSHRTILRRPVRMSTIGTYARRSMSTRRSATVAHAPTTITHRSRRLRKVQVIRVAKITPMAIEYRSATLRSFEE